MNRLILRMNLKSHYTNLYREAVVKIVSDNYQLDQQIGSETDRRFGITLLIRPDEQVKNQMQVFLDELKAIEPEQYYYPNSDIHITVLSIISCYNGFELSQISVPDYVEIIESSLKRSATAEIQFKGITASPSCVMVQGFPANENLNLLRDRLREKFKQSDLQQSIDQRYSIKTAHSTVMRFAKPFQHKHKLLGTLEKYRSHDFGTFQVKELELVYNDWYQRKEFVKTLHRFQFE